jgi:hypothetical protein
MHAFGLDSIVYNREGFSKILGYSLHGTDWLHGELVLYLWMDPMAGPK